MSARPPGANGTISRTGLVGQSAACTDGAASASSATNARPIRIIVVASIGTASTRRSLRRLAHDLLDDRRPTLALLDQERGELGRRHGLRFDRVVLDLLTHLRPVHGLDDL